MSTHISPGTIRERNRILRQLKDDHTNVKQCYQRFKRLDPQRDRKEVETLVREVVDMLDVHARLEEEWLYPQARDALVDVDLLDEAQIEHAFMHQLIEQLQSTSLDADRFIARFIVLCEYTLHHVKEEEGRLFPKLRKFELDWLTIGHNMDHRRHVLTTIGGMAQTAPAGLARAPYGDLRPSIRDVPGPAAYRVPAAKA